MFVPLDLPPLHCNGCRKCCEGDTITLEPGDDASKYETVLVNGQLQLAKADDGNCVYLGPRGCKIHRQAPRVCKALDCRQYAHLFETVFTPDQRRQRIENPLTAKVIREGASRLERLRINQATAV